jgi:hypothetical protein
LKNLENTCQLSTEAPGLLNNSLIPMGDWCTNYRDTAQPKMRAH